jgi:hypothetical protein
MTPELSAVRWKFCREVLGSIDHALTVSFFFSDQATGHIDGQGTGAFFVFGENKFLLSNFTFI